MALKRLRPIRRFVLVVDDPPEYSEGGIVVRRDSTGETRHLDYPVAMVGTDEDLDFGPGDRVVLAHPWAGRSVFLDGIAYRLVRVADIVGVVE